MSERTATDLSARDTILKLLTDDEVAKVSSADVASGLANGAEYLDLAHLDRGVRTAGILNSVNAGDVIPRTAVSAQTWSKITAELAGLKGN
ncbi:MAG: hypothetical protein ABL901_00195 [Hyphomicrobiaceae bacterium]